MNIGVSGASGQLGSTVLAELAKRAASHRLIAISRTPQGVPPWAEGRLGDYDDPGTLAAAYAGLDRLLLIPSADLRPGVLSAQIGTAVDAAVAAGVGQIFLMSGSGARRASGYVDHWTGEQRLIGSKAKAWTILRMGFFAETFAELARMSLESGLLPGLSENQVAFVSKQDVAAAVAGCLMTEEHAGATYNLSGPAAISGAERAAVVSQASGKSLSFTVLTEAQFRGGLAQANLPGFLVDGFVAMQKAFTSGAYDIITGDVQRLSGNAPRPLRSALAATWAVATGLPASHHHAEVNGAG